MTTRDERFAMLQAYLADAGFVLLDRKWHTVRHQYRFRCGQARFVDVRGKFYAPGARAWRAINMPSVLD